MGADSDVVKRSVEWLEVYIEITVCIVTRVRVPWIWEINLLTCKRNFIKITLKISTSPRIIVAEVASRWGRMWHHSNMTETSFYNIPLLPTHSSTCSYIPGCRSVPKTCPPANALQSIYIRRYVYCSKAHYSVKSTRIFQNLGISSVVLE